MPDRFRCSLCLYVCRSDRELSRHIVLTHTGTPAGVRPPRRASNVRHVERIHSASAASQPYPLPPRPYASFPCGVCGISFPTALALRDHEFSQHLMPILHTSSDTRPMDTQSRDAHPMNTRVGGICSVCQTAFVTNSSQVLPNGNRINCITQGVIVGSSAMTASQLHSPTGNARVSTIQTPQAITATVSQSSGEGITLNEAFYPNRIDEILVEATDYMSVLDYERLENQVLQMQREE